MKSWMGRGARHRNVKIPLQVLANLADFHTLNANMSLKFRHHAQGFKENCSYILTLKRLHKHWSNTMQHKQHNSKLSSANCCVTNRFLHVFSMCGISILYGYISWKCMSYSDVYFVISWNFCSFCGDCSYLPILSNAFWTCSIQGKVVLSCRVQFLLHFDAVVVDGRVLLPVDRSPSYHQTKCQTRRQNADNKTSDETRQNSRLQSTRRL